MTTPTYLLSCPHCGAPLRHHAGDHQSTPWICTTMVSVCGRGWFADELGPLGRANYRPAFRDFGRGPHLAEIAKLVQLELFEARLRGTSLRPDQISLADEATLSAIAKRTRNPAFAALVAQRQGKHT